MLQSLRLLEGPRPRPRLLDHLAPRESNDHVAAAPRLLAKGSEGPGGGRRPAGEDGGGPGEQCGSSGKPEGVTPPLCGEGVGPRAEHEEVGRVEEPCEAGREEPEEQQEAARRGNHPRHV
jgi:hypothetical protein